MSSSDLIRWVVILLLLVNVILIHGIFDWLIIISFIFLIYVEYIKYREGKNNKY